MALRPARPRLTAVALATVLVAGLSLAQPAAAAPAKDPDARLIPLGTAHATTPATSRASSTSTQAEDPVAEAVQQWRDGDYKPRKGQPKASLRVQIAHDKTAATAALARRLGATNIEEVTGTVLVADVPFDKLEALQDDSHVSSVQIPPRVNSLPESLADSGLAITPPDSGYGGEILAKTNAKAWHAAGLTGAGVKVGVIDFFGSAAWESAKTAGQVNAGNVKGTLCRDNGSSCNIWSYDTEHGVGVVEILNDMAPKAQLYLASAVTLADTKAAIDFFAANGVKIITRSLATSYDSAGNGTGPAAALVDYAVGKGMTWFNAAGNAGRTPAVVNGSSTYVGGYWRGGWRDTNRNGWLEFTGNNEPSSEFLPVDCGFFAGLRWNDWGESRRTDYMLVASVFDSNDKEIPISYSNSNQKSGADPIEGTEATIAGQRSFNNIDCDLYPIYYLSVELKDAGASSSDILEILVNATVYYYATSPGSAAQPFVDSKNPGLAAVGAVDPVGGTAVSYYSSQGPTNDGRIKPELVAGSGFSSYTYREEANANYDGGFHGTSASSPVVAGAAALVMQSTGNNPPPAMLVSYLRRLATLDRGAKGTDNAAGAGELVLGGTAKIGGAATVSFANPKVGTPVTANVSGWSPAPTAATYQWFANGVAIPGAQAASFTPTAAQWKKSLSVRVIGGGRGQLPVFRASAVKVVATGTLTAPTPKIGGNLAVGQKVKANTGAWTKGTQLTYQWYSAGKAIKGAKWSSFKIGKAQKGKTLRVKATGKQTGFTTVTRTSAASAKLLAAAKPKISGTKKVGRTLSVKRGTWTTKVKFSYQWYRGGKVITGATGTKYKLKSSDAGTKITVKVTGKRSGYATVTLTSSATATIKR